MLCIDNEYFHSFRSGTTWDAYYFVMDRDDCIIVGCLVHIWLCIMLRIQIKFNIFDVIIPRTWSRKTNALFQYQMKVKWVNSQWIIVCLLSILMMVFKVCLWSHRCPRLFDSRNQAYASNSIEFCEVYIDDTVLLISQFQMSAFPMINRWQDNRWMLVGQWKCWCLTLIAIPKTRMKARYDRCLTQYKNASTWILTKCAKVTQQQAKQIA